MYLIIYEVYSLGVFKDETASRDFGIEYSSNKMLQCSLQRWELYLYYYLLSAISDTCYHVCIEFGNS